MNHSFFSGDRAALFTDLYELTMAQAYLAEDMLEPATFSLFYRELPANRNYMLACGAEDVADFLAGVKFSPDDIAYLRAQGKFSEEFLDYLANFKFSGDVHAMPDGTPVFPLEPLLEVTAPLPEAQIMETWVMNQIHAQTVLASKAARIVSSAQGKDKGDNKGRVILDFGLRRSHGADIGLKAARAFHIAGVTATSNVLAGRIYDLPIAGTMAHSYIQAHDSEMAAFRAFVAEFPDTVLLVDTYDTIAGVRKVVKLAEELGDAFRVRGVRLDSGDLAALAKETRSILDHAGLDTVKIFASGGLNEFSIRELLDAGAPIDGFGIGTAMSISPDAPDLDIAYKLVDYGGKGRLKLSTGKETLPGAKQVFREYADGVMLRDTLARREETLPGTALLEPLLQSGKRIRQREHADTARERAARAIATLPDGIRSMDPTETPYRVVTSDALKRQREEVRRRIVEETP